MNEIHPHHNSSETNTFLISVLDTIRISPNYETFLAKIVKETTSFLGYKVGHYYTYVLGEDRLESSGIFYTDSPKVFASFEKVTKSFYFEKGVGLPGTAWQKETTVNFTNVFDSDNFPRAKAAPNIKVKGGVAFPLKTESEFMGVLEFYSTHEVVLSPEEIQICNGLSQQLANILYLYKLSRNYELILSSLGEGVYGLDLNGNTTFVNPAACKILGYQETDLIGKPMHQMVHYAYPDGKAYPRERCPMYGAFKEGKVTRVDNEVLWHKEGHAIPVRYTSTPIYESHVVQGAVVTFLDTSKEKQATEALEYLAHFDSLTNLPNRRSFLNELEATLSSIHQDKSRFAVIFIDVDNFKNFNDQHGHELGDKLLASMAEKFTQVMKGIGFLARIGGDEFAGIIESLTSLNDLSGFIENLLRCGREAVLIDGHRMNPSISIGVAVYPEGGHDAKTLLKHADIAMYRAKEQGKDAFTIFTEEIHVRVRRVRSIELGLPKALEDEEFYLEYQPIYDLKTKKVYALEALVRWHNPSLSNPGPDEFIPIAELSHAIEGLGTWILNQALSDFKQLQKHHAYENSFLSLNISATQIKSKNFFDVLMSIVNQHAISPHSLILEVTETAVMEDVSMSSKVLEKLSLSGFKVALDDFGTGHSSMLYLKKLPINYLKIDKEFIKDIHEDSNDTAIVKAIIGLAKSLELHAIAEGVETDTQLSFLESHTCNMFQGFLYARPMSVKALLRAR